MKHLFAISIVVLCILFVTTPACVGNKTNKAALFPSLQLTWPAVQDDYVRGIQDGMDDGELTPEQHDALDQSGNILGNAIANKDLDSVRMVSWEIMEPWAERGIQDKLDDVEIGPGVAVSLREQLSNFTETLTRLQGTF